MANDNKKKNLIVFGGLGAAAIVVASLYIVPMVYTPTGATKKPSPLRATMDNFFKIRVGENSPFFAEAKGGREPYQYEWNFGDGSKSTEKSTSHTFAKEGTYRVELTVTDSTGAKATIGHGVDVYPPNANFTRGDDILRR